MATVGAYDANTHLLALLERVESGESITITRHGHSVAELVPAGAASRRDMRDVIEEIETFRAHR